LLYRGKPIPSHKNLCIVLCAASLLFLFLSSITPVFSQRIDVQEDLDQEVTVTLKLIQVYVTDKEGNPVADLEKDEFELNDNGEVKDITDFERHNLYSPAEKILEQQMETVASTQSKLSRKFIFFFDFAFNSPGGILDSRKAALHFMDTGLRSTDEVGVISYSATKGLAIHEFMTTDHQKVREVILGLGMKDILGRADDLERRYWRKVVEVKESRGIVGDREMKRLEKERKALAAERIGFKQQVLVFMQTFTDLAKTLRYSPGQKNVLLFSSGIPGSILQGVPVERLRDLRGEVVELAFANTYEEMAKELAASNSIVFAMNSGRSALPINWDRDLRQRPIQTLTGSESELTGSASLKRLSTVTDGKYFNDVKNYETIMQEIRNITGSYYVLGYYINEKWDGKYHTIKVSVRRKDCQVRSQGGYFNPKPFGEFSKLEKLLHFVDLALREKTLHRTPLYFPLKAFHCPGAGEANCVMLSKFPGDNVEQISGEKVEIAHIAFGENDNVVDFKRGEMDFTKFPKRDIFHYSLSSLSPGKYIYRVVIRNLKTGRAAVSSSSVEIGKIPDKGIELIPPLLLLPEKNAFYLKESMMEKKEVKSGVRGLSDIYPFDLAKFRPVVEGFPGGTQKLTAVLPCALFGIKDPEIKPFARLINRTTGEIRSLKFYILHKRRVEGMQFFILGIPTSELERGEYAMDFLVKEMTTESISQKMTTFIVK